MNLKFYLRGLGIGMAVTALLLHFAPQKPAPEMSEKEIIEKAKELGMTEKVTLKDVIVEEDTAAPTPVPTVILLPKSENTPTPATAEKPTSAPTPETTATPTAAPTATPEEKPTATPTPKPTATPTEKPTATPTPKPTATATPTAKPTATPTPKPTATPTATPTPKPTATPTPKPTATPTAAPTATPTPKPTKAPTPSPKPTEAPTPVAPSDDGSPKSLNQSSVEISVTPGDSSYTVAKRLAEAGVVPSAAEFDEYLCKNGFDRKIATGMHTIPANTSYKRIGEILSGKK
ncbi:MAG: endolytic transglycosylase MltG [Lachnospiraceae bacterium]|nr:endolytic transglycosylase MltG [Lachnospiraceae bacterium]